MTSNFERSFWGMNLHERSLSYFKNKNKIIISFVFLCFFLYYLHLMYFKFMRLQEIMQFVGWNFANRFDPFGAF